MKELAEILAAHANLAGSVMALATVVRVQGSAYRRPGARMLITSDGHTVGGVSGGCLERDVIQRAGGVMLGDQPALVRYDTTRDSDGGGYSLGCGGTIDILIEPLATPGGVRLIQWLAQSRSQRLLLATVISKRHPTIPLGERVSVDEAGQILGQIGGEALCSAIVQDAGNRLDSVSSSVEEYVTPAGTVEVFMEVLEPPLELLIFGAGSDAVPLVEFARSLGWRITVVDVRSAPLDPGRVWTADRYLRCKLSTVGAEVSISRKTAAVVMTHNLIHDAELIRWLSGQPLGYLGLLGPRHRAEAVLGDLPMEGIHSPVGLDIGADNPRKWHWRLWPKLLR